MTFAKPRSSPPVADRIDDDVGPEARAVLADAPAFAFKPAFALRGLSARFGKPGCAILVGVEAGEMLADDFVVSIALEALGTGFQLLTSPRVQHVDGVIRDRLDQQAVTALGRLRGFKSALRTFKRPSTRAFIVHLT